MLVHVVIILCRQTWKGPVCKRPPMGEPQLYGALPGEKTQDDVAQVHEAEVAQPRISRSAIIGMVS